MSVGQWSEGLQQIEMKQDPIKSYNLDLAFFDPNKDKLFVDL